MKVDWGSVPAWLGAVSILLAFRIFLRDRATADRTQVNAAAVWWEIDAPVVPPWEPRVEQIKIRMSVRNSSDLPVELTYIALGITTKWSVPDHAQVMYPADSPNYPGVWSIESGTQMHRQFAGPIVVPPQETMTFDWQEINVAHLAPADATQLDVHPGSLRCILRWALVTDNAGRRWQTRHSSGKRAKRVRWWSRHDEHFPYDWKSPIVRKLWETRNRVRETLPSFRRK